MPTITSGLTPFSIGIDPTGRFAYAANIDSDSVSAYNINPSTGVLSAMSVPSITVVGSQPTSVKVDPTGRFAYVVNSAAGNLSAYNVDAGTGAFSPMSVPTVGTGTNPQIIVFSR